MDVVNKTEQEHDKFQYSFTEDFRNFTFIKQLATIVLLPLVPIYIISNGFQMRAWKKTGGEYPPSALKTYIVLILLYIILQLPLYITVVWFYLLIGLWPVTIIVAIYLYRKDYSKEKEKIKHGTKSHEFKIIGFRRLSLTFLVFLFFTLIFTISGFFFLFTITSLVFIFFPRIYKRLYFVPKKLLFLSYSFFSFLNVIPGIYVSGEWFIEKESEIKVMDNPYHIIKFIVSNFEPFFILNVGISALMVRIIVWFKHDQLPTQVNLISRDYLSSWGFFAIFLLVPIIMSIYFVWVWVWDDAEIKVAKSKFSSGFEEEEEKIKETTLLLPVSDSVKRLFTYLFGLSPIYWLVDIASTHGGLFENANLTGTLGLIILFILAFFVTGISTIFMGIMYYRSGVHEELVNKLRSEIKQMYLNGDSSIKVAYSGIQEVEPKSV